MNLTRSIVTALVLAITLTSCVETSTIPLANNLAEIVAEAAPACGVGGAQKAAQEAAAVTTISSGFDRFAVIGTSHPGRDPAYISHIGSASFVTMGRSKATMTIKMFKNGDPDGRNALDARSILGPDWQATIRKGGPTTC